MIIDFSNYPLSNIYYGGSEKKTGILINQEPYMLKFQKITPFGKRFNHISEFLGSHIFELLGFNVHKTILGIYQNNEVVACKDFVTDDYKFAPFNDVGESSLEIDKELYQYNYEDIVTLLEHNKKITNVDETVSTFFDMYIVDALIGNFDRHGANWGFLKKKNKYVLAPIFDNGSSLFPQMIDENEMLSLINNEAEIDKRVYTFPTSQIKLNNQKPSYFEVISSLKFPEINASLKRIFPKINLSEIFSLIDQVEISIVHKKFYKTIIKARYEKIIAYSFNKLMEKQNETIL